MNTKITIKEIAYAIALCAVAILLSQIFHIFGGKGHIFLPMHIPVILGGMFLGARNGAIIGAVVPLISFIITGGEMPTLTPVPELYFMMCELAAYGFVAGFLNDKLKLNPYIVLIVTMISGRLALMLSVFLFTTLFYQHLEITPLSYMLDGIKSGIIGIVIQIAAIPILFKLGEGFFEFRKREKVLGS